MSITVDQLRQLLAHPGKVYAGQHKLGSIGQVYVDDASGDPSWVTVTTGLFGTSESFVPLEGARIDGDDIVVAFEEQAVRHAPRVDPDGSLSPEEEEQLYRHYGLHGYGQAQQDATAGEHDRSDAAGTVGHDTSGPTTDTAMTRSEEQLRVSTRTHETGRARLRKYVVSERVARTVPVRHEELTLEREPITDASGTTVPSTLSEDEVEIVLHEEVPVVDKEVVAAERVRLATRTVTEQTTVSGEVRREEIELEAGTRPSATGERTTGTTTADEATLPGRDDTGRAH